MPPDNEGESALKVPTLVSYEVGASSNRKFAWAAAVTRLQDSIVGIKLLLDPSQERPLYLPTGNLKKDIRKLPKPPTTSAPSTSTR